MVKKSLRPKQDEMTDYDPEPIYMNDDSLDDFKVNLDINMNQSGDAEPQWYAVHCYSGYENKVRYGILQRIESMGMRDRIFDVIIPTKEEIEIKDGKKKPVERRVYPGYILVKMLMDEDSWYVVRNTPGVTGFVGMGNDPSPLLPEEVQRIIHNMETPEAPTVRLDFNVGQKVRIVGGPFNDFIGNVASIDADKQKVRVMVDFFGREVPVDLGFLDVEKT